MHWANYYIPPTADHWHGRADIPKSSAFYQLIQLLDLRHTIPIPHTLAFGLLGFRCDEGIRRNLGRVGAAEGPKHIREMLAKLAVNRQNIICFDAGDITCENKNLEEAQHALAETVALLLKANITPILLGGGHEIAFGHYQGIIQYYAKKKLAIVNFDAHFDMRPLLADFKGSSGTSFLQIAEAQTKATLNFDYNCIGIQPANNIPSLFHTASHYHTHSLLADELQHGMNEKLDRFIKRIIDNNDIIYNSVCLDVFAAFCAPGVSAPQALGVLPWQVIPLLRQLASSGKTVSYDIAELSPKYDIDQRTAKLAANIIYEIIHHHKHYEDKS